MLSQRPLQREGDRTNVMDRTERSVCSKFIFIAICVVTIAFMFSRYSAMETFLSASSELQIMMEHYLDDVFMSDEQVERRGYTQIRVQPQPDADNNLTIRNKLSR